MRAVIQRVQHASVHSKGQRLGEIGQGMLILLGVEEGDSFDDISHLCYKIARLRIFPDKQGRMQKSMHDLMTVRCLVVSQFTLFGSVKKGHRPSFTRSAKPEFARMMYEIFIKTLEKETNTKVEQGAFGADMQVELLNDGPVTLLLDSKIKDL